MTRGEKRLLHLLADRAEMRKFPHDLKPLEQALVALCEAGLVEVAMTERGWKEVALGRELRAQRQELERVGAEARLSDPLSLWEDIRILLEYETAPLERDGPPTRDQQRLAEEGRRATMARIDAAIAQLRGAT